MGVVGDVQVEKQHNIEDFDNEDSDERDSDQLAGQRIFDEVAGGDMPFAVDERQSRKSPSSVLPEIELVDGRNVDGLIKQLGHDDFSKREKASEDLAKMGLSVLPDLAKVADDPAGDPEVRLRARRIIDDAVRSNLDPLSKRLHPPSITPILGVEGSLGLEDVHGHFGRVLKEMNDIAKHPENNERRIKHLEGICRMNENGQLPLSAEKLEAVRREVEERKSVEEDSIKIRLSYADYLSTFDATDAVKENLTGLIKDKPKLAGSEHLLHLIGRNRLYEDKEFMELFVGNGGDTNKIPKYQFKDPDKGAAGRGEDTIGR